MAERINVEARRITLAPAVDTLSGAAWRPSYDFANRY
jgi:hypothetical protein